MFEDAIKHLRQYRIRHSAALNNEKRDGWFTSGIDSLEDIYAKIFDSKKENEASDANFKEKGVSKIQLQKALGLKVHFLVGCRQDIFDQFIVNKDDPKTGMDFDRHEYSGLAESIFRTDELAMRIKAIEDAG